METTFSFNNFSDRDLLAEVSRLAASEREATARLVASLAEVDARRLYLSEGCSSLFTYCMQVLTAAGARLSATTADAPRRVSWSSTTSCPTPTEEKRRSRIWSFGVGRTTR